MFIAFILTFVSSDCLTCMFFVWLIIKFKHAWCAKFIKILQKQRYYLPIKVNSYPYLGLGYSLFQQVCKPWTLLNLVQEFTDFISSIKSLNFVFHVYSVKLWKQFELPLEWINSITCDRVFLAIIKLRYNISWLGIRYRRRRPYNSNNLLSPSLRLNSASLLVFFGGKVQKFWFLKLFNLFLYSFLKPFNLNFPGTCKAMFKHLDKFILDWKINTYLEVVQEQAFYVFETRWIIPLHDGCSLISIFGTVTSQAA